MYEIVKIADIYTKYLKVPTRIIAQKIKRAELMKVLKLMFPDVRNFLLIKLSLFKIENFTTSISIDFFIILLYCGAMRWYEQGAAERRKRTQQPPQRYRRS